MARIEGVGSKPAAAAQFRAIAWVRWRMFVNAFQRKGGKGELVARILLVPFFALFAIGPITGSGLLGYYAVAEHHAWALFTLMWAVSAAWVFVMSAATLQPGNLDVSLLLRFPMSLGAYVTTRFFLGLLAAPNVIGTLALAAAAIGIGVARHSLFAWAALVLFVYALMMILLLRMVLLWLDRWLAQRRTREIVGVLFTLFFLSFQFVNAQMQSWRGRGRSQVFARYAFLLPAFHFVQPVVAALPPALAARSILKMEEGDPLAAFGTLGGVVLCAGVFTALFVLRLQGEFRGENFNEAPVRAQPSRAVTTHAEPGLRVGGLPAAMAACVEKEVRYLMRGPSMLLGVLTPLVLVGLYANRMGKFELLLPCAIAYTLFSMLPLLYNIFGQDAAGVQLYLFSPTPIRTVFLAKNLVLSLLISLVAGVAAALVSFRNPPSAPVAIGTALWFAFVLFTNLSFGNSRSITAPRKVDMAKIQRRPSTSQASVLIVLGVLFGSLLAGFAILWTCQYFGYVWAAPALLLAMAIAAIIFYVRTLSRIGRVMSNNRDVLIEALGKG